MKNTHYRNFFTFLVLLVHTLVFGQFMDKSHYLTDSLSKEDLSEKDVVMLDSLLSIYHQSEELAVKLDVIDKILESAVNDVIVDKYSNYLLLFTVKKLNEKTLSNSDLERLKKYKGVAYNYKALFTGAIGNRDLARSYMRKALALFLEVNFQVGLGYIYNNMAADFNRLGHPDSALFYYRKGLQINIDLDEKVGIASLQYNIAGILDTQGRVIESVNLYLEALVLFEEINNKGGVAYTLNNLATISYMLDDYDKAIEYLNRSMKIFEDMGHQSGIAYCLSNLGSIYLEKGDYDRAFNMLNKSLVIRKASDNQIGIIDCLNNIADIHIAKREYKKARELVERALVICRKTDHQEKMAKTLKNLGCLDIVDKKWRIAKQRLDSALVIGQKIGSITLIQDAAKLLTEIAQHNKKWNTAFAMQTIYYTMRDSTKNDEARNAVILGEMTYKHEKEAFADSLHFSELQRIKQLEHDQSIQQANIFTIFGLAGAFLMLILVFVLYFGYKQKKISNIALFEKNKENELLLGEIHHRVKNNLQVISSLLSLQERNITDKAAKAAILEGKERVQSMGLIHKMLYQQNNFSGINMSEYIEKLIAGLLDSFGKKSEDFELNYNISNISLDVDTAIPLGLIINELVVNSLKHAYNITSEPQLTINLQEVDRQLILKVADNGLGEVVDIQSSRSFGMKLVKSLSRQLSGTISIEQQNGLSFKIAISDYKLI